MRITSEEYQEADRRLCDLARNFIKQEHCMEKFQKALNEVKDEQEQAVLVMELGKMMDEFAKRVNELG